MLSMFTNFIKHILIACICVGLLSWPYSSTAEEVSLCEPVFDSSILFVTFECLNDSTAVIINSTTAGEHGWQYSDDKIADGVTFGRIGGEEFEIYGIAFRETKQELWFVLNANLPLTGFESSHAEDDNLGWGDLFIDLNSATDFKSSSNTQELFAIRFAGTNDSAAPQTGVYGMASAMSVSSENHGFNDWDHYVSHLNSQGGTPGLGDFGHPQTYYAGDLSSSVLNEFSRLGELSYVSMSELHAANYDDSQFDGIVSIAFKIDKRLIIDECGVVGGDGSSCTDCAGVPCGTSTIDECGVCEGDNSTCLDCAGIPNGETIVDECGICGGDGTSCLDCTGMVHGSATVDVCGICGGDGSSCLDCAGTPFGSQTVDVCGICGGDGKSCLDCAGKPNGTASVDRCGVCGGDGTSCLDCSSQNITETQFVLDGNAVGQRRWNLRALRKVERLSRRVRKKRRKRLQAFVEKARERTEQFYIANWNVVWSLPSVQQSCANQTFCASVSNLDSIDMYEENARGFLSVLKQTVRRIRRLSKRGRPKARKFRSRGKRLLNDSLDALKQVPRTRSVCS